MKIKLTSAVVTVALMLGGVTAAFASPVIQTACKLADVSIEGGDALACAGSYLGNDDTSAGLTHDLSDPPKSSDKISVNALVDSNWLGAAPLLGTWLFGAKLEGTLTTGALGAGSITMPSAGNFTIDISPFAEVILAFKQGTELAFYYFKNDGAGEYSLSWTKNTEEFSHLSAYVRGDRPPFDVPEPGTLALLGFGLLGFGLARRRAKA